MFIDSSDVMGNATDDLQAVHLMPTQANAYVLIQTNGKAFSNLPEHTWKDYAKMADKLPIFAQHMAPLPPMPIPPQVPQAHPPPPQPQPQQHQGQPPGYIQSQRTQSGNCCPPINSPTPHSCCAPAPAQTRPWPMNPVNAPASVRHGIGSNWREISSMDTSGGSSTSASGTIGGAGD